LDAASAAELARLLLEVNRQDGVALIVVTHALDLARQMQRVYELRQGELRTS
jgi:putative ABC transport system ATP-binding protein